MQAFLPLLSERLHFRLRAQLPSDRTRTGERFLSHLASNDCSREVSTTIRFLIFSQPMSEPGCFRQLSGNNNLVARIEDEILAVPLVFDYGVVVERQLNLLAIHVAQNVDFLGVRKLLQTSRLGNNL